MRKTALITISLLVLASCSKQAVFNNTLPPVFPDYVGVTIPAGIAPLDFNLPDSYDKLFVVVTGSKEGQIKHRGNYAKFNIRRWHRLTRQNAGGELRFRVAGRKDGIWTQWKDFQVFVSADPLADYGVTYRKFAPGYETYSKIGIYQRDIHSWKESPIIEGNLIPGQCVGCHTANATNPDQFLFHVRGKHGATVVQLEGRRKWMNTKTDSTISNAVYSYWHPSGDFVAHSNNHIHQLFWTGTNSLIEVYDDASDVVVHNVRTDEYLLSSLLMTDDFETYPAFSPDGRTLYFCKSPWCNLPAEVDKAHYSLCSIGFDAETQTFGDKVTTLIDAPKMGKSVSFPRPSFDGRWLLYSLSDYGCFPINHKEADLWLMDVATGRSHPLETANSEYDESFHNWSSDSHWILFASRRGDSLYSCIYICHIDENGNAGKPFLLPQKNPWKYYHGTLFTFNVPDFTCSKVRFRAAGTFREAFSDERSTVSVKQLI